jgi:outer membrane protein OmpA-like peptidoglycan-associated protein
MVKSPVTQSAAPAEKRKSKPKGENFLLVSIFRLLLLGVSGSLAALVGMAIAQFYPDQAQEPPIVEKALRQSQNWINQQKQTFFPQAPIAPVAPSQPSIAPSIAPSPINQLPPGSPTSAAPFNSQPIVATPVPPAAPESSAKPLIVTLPSDVLFDATQTNFSANSSLILDSLIGDLQRYPGAAIRVSAYVDEQGSEEADRARSFGQAKAVKQYLASKLGENYEWVAIAYGHSRPIAGNGSPGDRQRNRRIEIAIEP